MLHLRRRRLAVRRLAIGRTTAPRPPGVPAQRSAVRRSRDPLIGIARSFSWILDGLGVAPRDRSTSDDRSSDRARGGAVVVAGLVVLIMPALGLLIGVVGWNLPRVLAAQRRRRATSALVDESLLATELCAVSVHTGATVPQAIDVVAPYLFGPLGVCLTRVSIEHADGMLLDDGLASVTDELGEVVAPLVTILRAAHVDGDPVEPALSRLADRMRDDHRRLVETAVRQLSVRLLIPLVCCSLPGFVLIAVVPLVLGPLGTAGT